MTFQVPGNKKEQGPIEPDTAEYRAAKKLFAKVKKNGNNNVKEIKRLLEEDPWLKERTYNSVCHVAARYDQVDGATIFPRL